MADSNIVTATTQVQGTTGVIQLPQNVGESITVSGTIIGRDANGNFLLRTSNGNLTLHSSFPLTYNSDVVLRLSNNGSQGTSARIVSVNGEAFSQFAQPEATQTDSVSSPLLNQPATQTAGAQVAETNAQSSNPDSIPAVIVTSPSNIADNSPEAPAQVATQASNPTPAQLPPSGSAVVISITPEAPPAQAAVLATGQNPAALPQQATGQPVLTPQPTPQTATAIVENPTEVPSPQLPVQQANLNTNNTNQALTAKTTQPVTAAPTQVQLQGSLTETAVEQTTQTAPSPLYAAYARQIANAPQQPSQTEQTPQTTPPPSATNSLPARPAPVQGQVISASDNGTVKIQTAAGEATLQVDSPAQLSRLQPGTAVTIELPPETSGTPQTPTQPILSETPASFAQIAASWDTLKAIVTMLNNTGNTSGSGQTAPAGSLLANIPALGSSFSASSLSFIAALTSGDASKILGEDTVNNLKSNGQSALLQRFSAEITTLLGTLTAARSAPQTPTWQTTFLPFFYQGELQQARIYVKRDSQNKKQQAGVASTGGTRFIVEVDLSELGGVQIDGLVRKKQANTIFDLMIRSNADFSPQEKAEMTEIYNNAAQATGFSGTLGFQLTNDFPVKPLDEILANQNNTIVA